MMVHINIHIMHVSRLRRFYVMFDSFACLSVSDASWWNAVCTQFLVILCMSILLNAANELLFG